MAWLPWQTRQVGASWSPRFAAWPWRLADWSRTTSPWHLAQPTGWWAGDWMAWVPWQSLQAAAVTPVTPVPPSAAALGRPWTLCRSWPAWSSWHEPQSTGARSSACGSSAPSRSWWQKTQDSPACTEPANASSSTKTEISRPPRVPVRSGSE